MGGEKTSTRFVLNAEELRALTAHAVTRAFPKNTIQRERILLNRRPPLRW